MKKSIVMFIMLILDLVIYFSIVDINFQQSIFNYLKVLLLVLIIPLLYIIINDVIKVAKLKFDELIEFNKKEKSNIDLRIETLINENEKIRLENNKIMENVQNNNEELCKCIINVQEELTKGMDKLINSISESMNKLNNDSTECMDNLKSSISNLVEDLSINVKNATNTVKQGNEDVIERVNALIDIEKRFIENINVSIDALNNRHETIYDLFTLKNNELRDSLLNQYNELSNILGERYSELNITLGNNYEALGDKLNNKYTELTDALVEKYQELSNSNSEVLGKLNERINSGIKQLIKSEENNKEIIEENLGELAALIEDTIRELQKSLTEAIEDNNEGLSRVISKNLSKLDKNNEKLNNKWQELSTSTHLENKDIIVEIRNSISKVAKLHNDMLIKMDENQNKLLELNKEDINLMKELIR